MERVTSLLLLGLFTSAAPATAQPASPTRATVLSTLRQEHPRLLATAADFGTLKARVAESSKVAKWAAAIRAEADEILKTPPSQYVIPDGKRLLATSRRVLDRVLTLGLTFKLGGDARYSTRLWLELETAAKFKDWNPSHFLDTAEMTAAFAISYDWLYETWTPAQRATLRTAIIEKGLNQSLVIYRKNGWWAAAEHNWNQVCNGGMTLGALAVADEEPELASEILERAIVSVPRAMRHFAPDGAWGEGPGYWDYATKYNVFMLAALESALGTDFGLAQIEGFAKAADFPIHVSGPTGRTFNYADAGDGPAGGAQMLWLASKFNNPAQAAWRVKAAAAREPGPLDLLWGAAWLGQLPPEVNLPAHKYFRASEVVTMRSAWNDPDATFVGFKGGDNKVNHGHLDLGSFVLDAAGQRWAVDLGADNYNLPGYFGKARWDFYRCRAEGQNTLVINPGAGPDQDTKAESEMVRFEAHDGGVFGIADLIAAYAKQATKVQRGIALNGRAVVIQDEIAAAKPAEVWWFMHTGADVRCDGATAILTLKGKRLTARVLSPPGATFEVMPAEPLPTSPNPEGQNSRKKGVTAKPKKLAVHLQGVTDARLVVLLTPEEKPTDPTVVPLSEWK